MPKGRRQIVFWAIDSAPSLPRPARRLPAANRPARTLDLPRPERPVLAAHRTPILGPKLSFQDGFGQQVFDVLLDGLQQPGAETGSKPALRDSPALSNHHQTMSSWARRFSR